MPKKRKGAQPRPAEPPVADIVFVPPGGLVWRTEQRAVGDLVEWEANPRQLTEKQAADLKESLQRFGYVEPVAIDVDGKIVGGHQRRRILLDIAAVAPDTLIDVRVPNRPLTDDEFTELAIRLNKNTGEWDWDKLGNAFDIADLTEWGFDEKHLLDDQGTGGNVHELPPATQLKPAREYVVIVCADDGGDEFERLKVALSLTPVRRGGYRVGSPFDAVGTQRVVHAADLLAKLE